jgi:hypothetical protein
MADLPGLFTAAQDQIIVLGSVEFTSLPADFIENGFSYAEDMRNVIVAAEQVRIEIRFEIRAVVYPPLSA